MTDARRLVVATTTADDSDGGTRVLRLVECLAGAGVELEVLALAGGDRVEDFRRAAPTAVVWDLPGTALSALGALGGTRVRQAVRGRALRSWLRSRADAAVLIGHPGAASVLRFGPIPDRVVAMLPMPTWGLDHVAAADLATLGAATGWLVCNDAQAAEVADRLDRPTQPLGPLLRRSRLPVVTRSPAGAVVLDPSPDTWSSINHTVELVSALSSACANELRWVVHGDEDAWLARHDLAHTGLSQRVRLVSGDDPGVLAGCTVVVRSGYGQFDSPVVIAAQEAGVPVAGFGGDASLEPAAAFDVEAVVEQVLRELGAAAAGTPTVVHGPGLDPDPARVVEQVLSWLAMPSGALSEI